MLSDLLNSYAGHFGDWAKGAGVTMDPRVCALMFTNLTDAAEQARRLEDAVVPANARALPPDVVRLDDYRPAPGGGRAA